MAVVRRRKKPCWRMPQSRKARGHQPRHVARAAQLVTTWAGRTVTVALHVPRQRVIRRAGLLREGFQVLGQHLVERDVLGLVAVVLAGEWVGGGLHAAAAAAEAGPETLAPGGAGGVTCLAQRCESLPSVD